MLAASNWDKKGRGPKRMSYVDGPLPLLWLHSPSLSLSLGWSDGDNCHLWTHVTFVRATAEPRPSSVCLSIRPHLTRAMSDLYG